MNYKEQASEAAVKLIQSGMNVGLGTGSTADYFLIGLAREIKAGNLKNIRGVPTSVNSHKRAIELGIPLMELDDIADLDVTVDGADEVTDELDLIKGMGGALLREKMVAQKTQTFIIVADAGKRVGTMGTKSPLPVEVTRWSHQTHKEFLENLGCVPVLRINADGTPFVTDCGNYIYNCDFRPSGFEDPARLQWQIKTHAGVIDTGLFLGMAAIALIAGDNGVTRMDR
jgi:ribose 5-phosphate isomerase A